MVRFFSFKEELPIMKIICEKDLLVEAVSNVRALPAPNRRVPGAWKGILLKAQDGQLQLTGYDLELGIVTTIEAKTEQPGQLILSARLLLDIIRRIRRRRSASSRMSGIWQPSAAALRNLPSRDSTRRNIRSCQT